MNDKNQNFISDDLQAFVDGELDGERRRAVEVYLEQTPDAAATVLDWNRQNDMMRVLYSGVANERIPVRLDPHDLAGNRRIPIVGWRNLAASIMLFCLGIASGLGMAQLMPASGSKMDALVATAVEAHNLYADDRVRPVELDAEQKPALQKWLSGRLDRTINLPDLGSFGLQFVGGRLLPNGDGAAAQLMYQDEGGRRITLYVVPSEMDSGGDTDGPFLHVKVERLETVYWGDEGIRCAIVGNLPAARLQVIAKAAYRQLI